MEELTGYNLPDGDYWVKKVQQDENGTLIVLESKQFFGDNPFWRFCLRLVMFR